MKEIILLADVQNCKFLLVNEENNWSLPKLENIKEKKILKNNV